MDKLKDYIKEKRPSLGDTSLITYNSILKNLYYRVFDKEDNIDFKKFNETKPILNFLKDISPNKRKTILSALVIITGNDEYRKLMAEDVRDYNIEINKQEKSPEQKENWIDGNQINDVYEELKNNTELLYKKKNLTMNDLQQIQSFIIISLLGGIFIAPRRSKDFTDFFIKDFIDKSKENYIDKKKMFFNSYKTSKTYGEQAIDIPKSLQCILTKWIKVNPTKFLLFDSYGKQLTSVKLNQRMNKIFGNKKISVNAMRHSYLTDKYKKFSETEKQLSKDMSSMGSSLNMVKTYVKLD